MSIAVVPKIEYANIDASTIAASPAWTAVTASATSRPLAMMRIQATTGGGTAFEISIDGVNPMGAIAANAPLFLDFRANNLLVPAGVIVYARSIGGAAVGRFTVSLIEENIQSRGG